MASCMCRAHSRGNWPALAWSGPCTSCNWICRTPATKQSPIPNHSAPAKSTTSAARSAATSTAPSVFRASVVTAVSVCNRCIYRACSPKHQSARGTKCSAARPEAHWRQIAVRRVRVIHRAQAVVARRAARIVVRVRQLGVVWEAILVNIS